MNKNSKDSVALISELQKACKTAVRIIDRLGEGQDWEPRYNNDKRIIEDAILKSERIIADSFPDDLLAQAARNEAKKVIEPIKESHETLIDDLKSITHRVDKIELSKLMTPILPETQDENVGWFLIFILLSIASFVMSFIAIAN
jgi:hypothetical protein